ncbi:hypothetical protein [Maricaulis sp.]|uniref:hypothetical protein n=1 Tax=Maricaulis sp. TaxID=1486257 RepID=UPI003A9055ED
MAYDASRAARDDGGRPRGLLLFRMAYEGPDGPLVLRLSSGVGRRRIAANSRDDAAEIYSGAGQVINWPDIEAAINFAYTRVVVTLTGGVTNDAFMANVKAGERYLEGARVDLGFQALDGDYQCLGDPDWDARGEVDVVELGDSTTPEGAISGRVSLTINLGPAGRRRPRPSTITDADTKANSPGDRAAENLPGLHAGLQLAWGTR